MRMLKDGKVAARIPAQDPQRARAFYAQKLGLEPSAELPGGLLYHCGEGEFALFESAGAASGDHTQMGWEVEDIEATVEWLRARGVVFEEYDFPGLRTVNGIAEVRDSEGNLFGKGAWFRDSEGNVLGINRPTDELRRTMLGPDR
jgi:predicted enzyme related to lactoylglutathione lyase